VIPLLFDTGIYIRFTRGEDYLWLGEDAGIFQRTMPWATSRHLPLTHGSRPAFCYVAPEALMGKSILPIIFAIC
jgi:hypothetical protein